MANATYEVLEFRVKIESELTHLYVCCGPTSDGTIGVQGWHHKVIGASVPAWDAMRDALVSSDYLMWGQEAP